MGNDPRGPLRKIVAVDPPSIERPACITYLTLSCGHVSESNGIYSYKVGADCRCFACRKENNDDAGK